MYGRSTAAPHVRKKQAVKIISKVQRIRSTRLSE
jgi:hypothetical protein